MKLAFAAALLLLSAVEIRATRFLNKNGASLQVMNLAEDMDASDNSLKEPGPAVARVIGMLENLIAEMDAEQQKDDESFAEFQKWCSAEQTTTQQSIDQLTTLIEDLTASLAKLYSQKAELEAYIQKLADEIQATRTQIQVATEKRTEEHANFVKEQQNFDNSITACGKAIGILKEHYGDGTVQEAEKPAWMSLVQLTHTIHKAVVQRNKLVTPELLSFLQTADSNDDAQQQMKDRYAAKTGEALNIVDQMQVLSDTFAEDKQSAIDDENKLQTMYNTLMQEKTELLNSLLKEKAENEATLKTVIQTIGEQETQKANAESELKDQQAYLAACKKACSDGELLYEMRKKDRAEEKLATGEAVKVLNGAAGEAFIQGAKAQGAPSLLQVDSKIHTQGPCPQCKRAAAFLTAASRTLHSGTLATAAQATLSSDAVQEVIHALEGLIDRLDEDQKMETEHKDWCEGEMADATSKKAQHDTLVAEFTEKIADETETVEEKKQSIGDTFAGIQRADSNFAEMSKIREKEKADYEVELQNYKDAVAALNSAIDILAKFYKTKRAASFAQTAQTPITPGVFDSVYQQKGGMGVIGMIATIRKTYESGKLKLEKAEAQAVLDFGNNKDMYYAARRDLESQTDQLEVELQTAHGNLAQYKEDKSANENEVGATNMYLGQLSSSCDSLLKNYDNRVELRKEEQKAINKAVDVLNSQ
jgi:DNA repair exonuclease SbcCD ATPase subunit